MRISHLDSGIRTSFGSKNIPVEPFEINTKQGKLYIHELTSDDIVKSGRFSFKCGLESFQDWRESYAKRSPKRKRKWIKNMIRNHRNILKREDGNSTILVGKDQKGRIKVLFSLLSFDETEDIGVKDLKTGYVEECMIDSRYRNQGLGKILLSKLLETAHEHFTDIFLAADNKAVNFYSREGFENLDLSIPALKKLSETFLKSREDRDTITLMSRALDSSNPWWKRLATVLK